MIVGDPVDMPLLQAALSLETAVELTYKNRLESVWIVGGQYGVAARPWYDSNQEYRPTSGIQIWGSFIEEVGTYAFTAHDGDCVQVYNSMMIHAGIKNCYGGNPGGGLTHGADRLTGDATPFASDRMMLRNRWESLVWGPKARGFERPVHNTDLADVYTPQLWQARTPRRGAPACLVAVHRERAAQRLAEQAERRAGAQRVAAADPHRQRLAALAHAREELLRDAGLADPRRPGHERRLGPRLLDALREQLYQRRQLALAADARRELPEQQPRALGRVALAVERQPMFVLAGVEPTVEQVRGRLVERDRPVRPRGQQ